MNIFGNGGNKATNADITNATLIFALASKLGVTPKDLATEMSDMKKMTEYVADVSKEVALLKIDKHKN